MKPYIFASRNGIYIVDVRQTATAFREALDFLGETAANGGTVMFVATKRQAQEAVREAAQRTGMFFVNQRWLGLNRLSVSPSGVSGTRCSARA